MTDLDLDALRQKAETLVEKMTLYVDAQEDARVVAALLGRLEAAEERFEKADRHRLYWRRRYQSDAWQGQDGGEGA